MNQTLRRNLFWDYFNRFGNTVFALITTTILARILTPQDYGLVGIAMAVNAIAGIFLNLGFVSAIIQVKEIDQKSLSTVFFFNLIIAFSIYLSIFLSSNIISGYYEIPDLKNLLKITSLYFPIAAMSIVPNALLTRAMNFKSIAIVNLISSVFGGLIGVFMAINHFGFWSIIAQQLFTGFFVLIGYFIATKWLPIIYFKLKSIQHMLKFGVYMFLSGMLDSIYSRIDIFLIAKVFSPASLGLYTRAQGLDSQIRMLSSSSLLSVLFPTFAKIRDDKEQLKSMYYQYFELISFLFCLLAGIFYLSATPLFLLLFGAQWGVSADYFKILILAGFAYPLSSLSLSIIEARGNSKNFLKVEIIKKFIFLPTYFIAYYYGISAFLISFVIALFIATFINVRFLKFELDISVRHTIYLLSKYFVSSLVIVLTLELIAKHIVNLNHFFFTLIEVLLFVITYLGLHYSFKSKGINFALALIQR